LTNKIDIWYNIRMQNKQIQSIIEQLDKNGAISFVPTGNSMWPTLKSKGQSVVVQKHKARLNVLDVALFVYHEKLVLHRVIKVTEDGYLTCGDGMLAGESIKESDVLGVMQAFYYKNKQIKATDEKYIRAIKSWYSNPKKRIRKIKGFQFRLRVKSKLIRLFIRKGGKNV
jgi:hypothetical protein